MPVAVDVGERLDALARATFTVAGRVGADAVTIRAVARELGGSTTRVTNYLPTRTAVLLNAVAWMLRGWEDDRAAALADVDQEERLAALARWSCAATDADVVFRGLLVELISGPDAAGDLGPFVTLARRHRDELEETAGDARVPDPRFVADAVFLLVRGTHFASIEEPERWSQVHVMRVLERVLGLLTRPA